MSDVGVKSITAVPLAYRGEYAGGPGWVDAEGNRASRRPDHGTWQLERSVGGGQDEKRRRDVAAANVRVVDDDGAGAAGPDGAGLAHRDGELAGCTRGDGENPGVGGRLRAVNRLKVICSRLRLRSG